MKKILLLIAGVSLSIFVFGQSTDKGEVDKLRHDIKILQTENNKLKNELRDSVNSLDVSLATLKNLYQNANNEIKTDENSLGITTSSLAQLNEYTLTKFERHRSIIKIAILSGLLAIILFGIMIIMLYVMTRLNFNNITKNFDLNMTTLKNTAEDIDKKITSSNEIAENKINEIRKMLSNEVSGIKNSYESLVTKTKEQFTKDIAHSSQLGLSQLTEMKKETSEHFNLLNDKLAMFEKLIKDKLKDKG